MTKDEERQQAEWLVAEIKRYLQPFQRKFRFMEVCGTHTVAIFRSGIRQLLPDNVELVSGPGCPVCVTPDIYIDKAVAYAKRPEIIIATFGDMLKVPGSRSSLAEEAASGADIRVIYSPLDSLRLAIDNPDKLVVFLAVGFETTAPTEAAAIAMAKKQQVKNFYVLPALKLVPPALEMLLSNADHWPDGFLLPGHVAVITGTEAFNFVAEKYKVPGVVAGFEPLQILRAVYELARMVSDGNAEIVNAYPDVVRKDGNPQAKALVQEVFSKTAAEWRGLGMLAESGLSLSADYKEYDIEEKLPVKVSALPKKSACRCGDVLQGRILPTECPLFGKVCTPEAAKGPCMISVEGVCAAWFKYGGGRFRYER